MIKLFITDLDGCMSMPFELPNWEALNEIRALNELSQSDPTVPPITICTGRPLPYAEAIHQWMGMRLPFLFESGGGMYDAQSNSLTWHSLFTEKRLEDIQSVKDFLQKECVSNFDETIPEFAKHTDAGLINPDPKKIEAMLPLVESFVQEKYSNLEVHYTDVSINVISKATNKGEGIKMLCKQLGLGLHETAYIGDTGGDVPALKIVGKAFAPSNAKEVAKHVAEVAPFEATEAVLYAYKKVIEFNRTV